MSKFDLFLILTFLTVWIGLYFWYRRAAVKSESNNKRKAINRLGFASIVPGFISSTFSDVMFTFLGVQKVGWLWGSWLVWLILVIATLLIFRNKNLHVNNTKCSNNHVPQGDSSNSIIGDGNTINQVSQGDGSNNIIGDGNNIQSTTNNYLGAIANDSSKYQIFFEKLIDLKNLLDDIKYRSNVKSDCPKFQRLLKEIRTDLEKSQLTFSTRIIYKIENLLLEIDQFTSGTCIGLVTLEDYVAQIPDHRYQKIMKKYGEFECFLENQLPTKLNQLTFELQLDEYGLNKQAFSILKQFADIGKGELWLRESSNSMAFQIRTSSGSIDVHYSSKSNLQSDLTTLINANLISERNCSQIYVLKQKGIDLVSKIIE